ncbi:4-hydroxy-3-methylbut-2-enyl diphosphate reductase [Salinarimonas soli]|uniref:4-hydroxy-3-methylbut-2-enyl diphosphate reductase n=1 Tax=Salinarimonas soli TaxID=1638099 RepID=A0A5B2V9F8_9HYPH|nr:4-hydroxy-3-methylbut-2-enyl diphosphate reductase [Salinarimonas soli]KAA2235651.1 4-hydroxy-3-methylbut-2-enyl diphosphate reductase [Salinarimonas soli]
MAPITTPHRPPLRVVLAKPRGFCAGVERAIEIVEMALAQYGPPVYVRHQIVHNQRVVSRLEAEGAVFVGEVDDIPVGAVAVFSAHGVARVVERNAAARSLRTIDATCPLVAKTHQEGQRYARQGFEVVLIGHRGHPEVVGTLGRIPGVVHLITSVADVAAMHPSDPSRLAYVTQTTLSVDDTRDIILALKARFPAIVGPDTRDICYATQNRQNAVRALAEVTDVVLVLGAANSSNSNRLREVADGAGVPAYLIEDATALDPAWLAGASRIGVTAGASAPEELVDELLDRLRLLFDTEIETLPGIEESVRFRLPEPFARGPERGRRSDP